MEKRQKKSLLFKVSTLIFLCFLAPTLIGSSPENPIINTLYIPLCIGGSLATSSGVIFIMEQTATADSATATEEKIVKPYSEAPIRILTSIRISEKD